MALLGIIFGILGIAHANKYPKSKGTGHAIAGIILGLMVVLGLIGQIVVVVVVR